MHCGRFVTPPVTRREMLNRCASGFGAIALTALMQEWADATPPALLSTASGQHTRAHEMGAVMGLEKPFNVPELLDVADD